MAYSTEKRVYLGYIIAGAIVSVSSGSILAMGFLYAWMGGFFQAMMSGMGSYFPPISGLFGTMGIGMIIGGGIALVVGLSLLGSGVSKKKDYYTRNSPPSTQSGSRPVASTGREYPYNPTPAYGSISSPASRSEPVAIRCRSCGEILPAGMEAQFCPSCGAPTR